MHAHSPQKMHMRSCMRAYATVQKLLCHGSYCELILSLALASCRMSFVVRSPSCSTKSITWCCSLKLEKSVQIHARHGCRCVLAQASFNHPRWYRPHPVCLWFTLALGRGSHPRQNLFSLPFSRTSRKHLYKVHICMHTLGGGMRSCTDCFFL